MTPDEERRTRIGLVRDALQSTDDEEAWDAFNELLYDPILDLEAKGGRLHLEDGFAAWGIRVAPYQFLDGDGMFGSVTIADIREAARALLAKLAEKEADE